MLQSRLEKDRKCQFVGIGRDVRVLGIRESTGRVIHRTYHIARKGQRAIMGCSPSGQYPVIVVPFPTINRFHRHHVGISPLPSPRYGSPMEIHHQLMLGRILQQIDIIIHGRHAVAGKKIHLDAIHAQFVQPSEFLLAVFRLVQTIQGCGPQPLRTGIVPQQRLYTAFLRILHGSLQIAAVRHLVPFPINQTISPFHVGSKVEISFQFLEIPRPMVLCPINP